MKKILTLIFLVGLVKAQTLVKTKQIGDGLSTGSFVVSGGAGGSLTYSPQAAFTSTSALTTSLAAYQPSLNGTGFVKATGTVISYDANTYSTTSQISTALGNYVPYVGANSFTTSNNITAGSLISTGPSTLNSLYVPSTSTLAGNVTQNGIGSGNTVFGTNAQTTAVTNGSNTVFGYGASSSNPTGIVNSIIGCAAASSTNFSGSSEAILGYNAGRDLTTGGNNTFVGESSGRGATTSKDNVAIGKASGLAITTHSNIFLGCHSGRYANVRDGEFIVGSINRGSYANDTTYSILYGVMNTSNSNTNQRLSVNGGLKVYNTTTLTGEQNNGNMVVTGTGSVGSTFTCGDITVNNSGNGVILNNYGTMLFRATQCKVVSNYSSNGDIGIYSLNKTGILSNGTEVITVQTSAASTPSLKVTGTMSVSSTFSAGGRVEESQGAAVASANNLTLGSDGNSFEITGTTQINLIDNTNWKDGSIIKLLFTSTPVVKNGQATSGANMTIKLAGAVDFSATADDILTLESCTIGGVRAWREVSRSVN